MPSPADAATLVGEVALVVRLHPSNVVREDPAPLTFLLPRTTLLLSVLTDAHHHFAPYTASSEIDPWRTQLWFSVKMHRYQRIDTLAPRWHATAATRASPHAESQTNPSTATSQIANPTHSSSSNNNYPVSWLLPVGAIKDFAVEARRRAAWLYRYTSSSSPTQREEGTRNDDDDVDDVGTGGGGDLPASTTMTHEFIEPASSDSDAFDAFPLELYFHFHQCPTASDVNPTLPFHFNQNALISGVYTVDETRHLHKRAFTALYGTADVFFKLSAKKAGVLHACAHRGSSASWPAATQLMEGDEASSDATLMAMMVAGSAEASGTGGGAHRAQSRESRSLSLKLLAEYHTLFSQYPKTQKNAYVGFAFPLHEIVSALTRLRQDASTNATAAERDVPPTTETEIKTEIKTDDPPVEKRSRHGKHHPKIAPPTVVDFARPSHAWATASLFEPLVVPLTSAHGATTAHTHKQNMTFGELLWRLFRAPAQGRQNSTTTAASTSPQRSLMDTLLDAMLPYYAHDDDVNEEVLCQQFCDAYESAPRGLPLAVACTQKPPQPPQRPLPPPSASARDDAQSAHLINTLTTRSRVLFMVQGVCPMLYTPFAFLEEYLTSTTRILYITAKVETVDD